MEYLEVGGLVLSWFPWMFDELDDIGGCLVETLSVRDRWSFEKLMTAVEVGSCMQERSIDQ